MGSMDEAIKETVQDKNFKKINMKEYASRTKQVGGNHYKNFKIQPVEFITSNNLTFLEGNVIKYISRYPDKHADGLEDIAKAQVYLNWLMEYLVNQDVTVK